jgi:hypothetical protein
MSTARIAESHCLQCGAKLNALGDIADAAAAPLPTPGSLIVCIRCGAVMMCADDLTPRRMTDAELDDVANDTETMDELARHVQRIHVVRHSQS